MQMLVGRTGAQGEGMFCCLNFGKSHSKDASEPGIVALPRHPLTDVFRSELSAPREKNQLSIKWTLGIAPESCSSKGPGETRRRPRGADVECPPPGWHPWKRLECFYRGCSDITSQSQTAERFLHSLGCPPWEMLWIRQHFWVVFA